MTDSLTPRAVTPPLSLAPMMDRTDRHFRFFLRQISRRTLLYTEMITTGALLHGPRERLLAHHAEEHPVAIQLGGDEPEALATCARMAEDAGYDEVNLNVGCPSDRVKKGRFGACLMAEPERVADGVAEMRGAVAIPVTVKHRIGIDDLDRYEDMARFVAIVAQAGADRFSVHARKAWLAGLSPKENRTIPPLRYDDVYRLKAEFPHLQIEINGGITSLDQTQDHLEHVDGVMIGRAAYDDPWLFAEADQRLWGSTEPAPTRHQVVEAMVDYATSEVAQGVPLHHITRHLSGLFAGRPGSRAWRRHLSEHVHRDAASPALLREAAAKVPVSDPLAAA